MSQRERYMISFHQLEVIYPLRKKPQMTSQRKHKSRIIDINLFQSETKKRCSCLETRGGGKKKKKMISGALALSFWFCSFVRLKPGRKPEPERHHQGSSHCRPGRWRRWARGRGWKRPTGLEQRSWWWRCRWACKAPMRWPDGWTRAHEWKTWRGSTLGKKSSWESQSRSKSGWEWMSR